VEDITTDKNTGVHLKDLFDGVDKSRRWVVENTYADKQKDMFAVIEKLQYVAVTACDALVEDIDAKSTTTVLLSFNCSAPKANPYVSAAMFKTFDGVKPKVVRVDFDRLPASGAARAKAVEQNDAFLHSVMDMLPTKKYTVIFVSSPIGETTAAAPVKFSTPQEHAANLELRSVEFETEARNATLVKGGLFHRYQFFTPAIFTGYIVFFLMLAILYVGVSAVSSIGVSYGSFAKEMGPGAKKQQ